MSQMKAKIPSEAAFAAARSIGNYCSTRFPSPDAPVCDLLDIPWFAERVQQAIDSVWKCKSCGAMFPPIPFDQDCERCTQCVTVEQQGILIDKLRNNVKLLHDATIVLRNGMGGHNHWDHTMQHGAGCAVCIEQRDARREAERLIEQVQP